MGVLPGSSTRQRHCAKEQLLVQRILYCTLFDCSRWNCNGQDSEPQAAISAVHKSAPVVNKRIISLRTSSVN